MEKLSKEYMIQQVRAHKERIREATDQLSEILYKARNAMSKNLTLDETSTLAIRKVIHEIVSEISMIGGFCDKSSRNYIDRITETVGRMIATRIYYTHAILLEFWAVMVNSVIVDFTKTPFRLKELEPIFSVLKEALGRK